MRFILVVMLLAAAGCDAAFTDLRPQAVTNGPVDVDMGQPDEGGEGPDVGEVPDAGDQPDLPPAMEQIIAEGMFVPRASYGGEGTATLVRLADGSHEVRLGPDFSTGSVPGPTVVLAREDSLGPTLDPARGDLELGVLASNSGASTYAVPGDPGDRRIVWIYCKPFGLQMSSAALVAP